MRVGFVGTGFIAQFHLGMLRGSSDPPQVSAVVDTDPARAEAFATTTGAVACTTIDEVCEQSDAVFVCTWTSEHRHAVEAVVGHGLPVFCEKPLAPTLDAARSLTELVVASGVINQVGLLMRRYPAFNLARRLVHDEASGRPMAVVVRDDQYLPTQGIYDSDWRGDVARAGSGALLEHSIHDVDILEWLVGPAERVACWTRGFHDLPGIEDVASCSFAFAGGAVGTLVSVWHDVLERPSLRHVELFCERLHVVIEGEWYGPVRWTRAGEGEQVLEGADLIAALDPPLLDNGNADAEFIAAVTEGRRADPDVRVALRAHEVVDALYRSAAEDGRPIDVPTL